MMKRRKGKEKENWIEEWRIKCKENDAEERGRGDERRLK